MSDIPPPPAAPPPPRLIPPGVIVEHPFYCLILLGVVVLACGLGPFSSSSTENKRSAIINKHYNDTFKK